MKTPYPSRLLLRYRLLFVLINLWLGHANAQSLHGIVKDKASGETLPTVDNFDKLVVKAYLWAGQPVNDIRLTFLEPFADRNAP